MTVQNMTEEQFKADLKRRLKSGELRHEDAEAEIAAFHQAQRKKGGVASAIWEPTKAIVGSMAGQVAAGYGGLWSLATGEGFEGAAKTVEGIQEDVSEAVAPKTQMGQAGLENVGTLMEMGLDVARFPISGLAGLSALVTGRDPEDAARIVQDVQTKGVGQTAGDETFAVTGSPFLATAAYMSPEVILTAIPVLGKVKQVNNFKRVMAANIKDAAANPELAQSIANFAQQVASGELTASTFPQIQKLIEVSPPRIQKQLAPVVEDLRIGTDKGGIIRRLEKIADDANTPSADKELADYIIKGSDKAAKDPNAVEAVKQGFDQGVIASVKSASPEDMAYMRQMTDIMEEGKRKNLYAVDNRPSDIPGDNLMKRVTHIKKVNQDAGRQLDVEAKNLKGQQIDFTVPIENFMSRLDDIGVKLDANLNPVFKGSDIEMNKAAESAITNIIKRMKSGEAGSVPDAYDLHRLKKYIDDQVTYGKTAEGLAGKTEGILKALRSEVDDLLDSQFPEYNAVNTAYADTVSALDALQSAAGGKIDLFAPNADKAVGTLLRGLMSNNRGRIELSNAINDLESVARKYGGNFNDNIKVQMMYANELDSVFGPVARTSLEGSQAAATAKGVADVMTGQSNVRNILADTAVKMSERLRGINQENAFAAIKKVLEQ